MTCQSRRRWLRFQAAVRACNNASASSLSCQTGFDMDSIELQLSNLCQSVTISLLRKSEPMETHYSTIVITACP
jgi:hypothetical protein